LLLPDRRAAGNRFAEAIVGQFDERWRGIETDITNHHAKILSPKS
jgi:hypothetical protein